MRARAFWRTVTADHSELLDRFLALLSAEQVGFCLIGGQAVNAYVEPVVSLDLDVAVAMDDQLRLEQQLQAQFLTERFPHSLNVASSESDLRIQIQTDPRYGAFVSRAEIRDVLGLRVPVASPEDLLQGKVWAVEDPRRRASKRQKDLADISRLLDAFPHLRARVPAAVLARLF